MWINVREKAGRAGRELREQQQIVSKERKGGFAERNRVRHDGREYRGGRADVRFHGYLGLFLLDSKRPDQKAILAPLPNFIS